MRAGAVWAADDMECRPVSLRDMSADVDARPSRASAVPRNTQGAEKRTFIALHGSSLDSIISHDSTSLCCSSIKPRASYSRASMYSYSSLHQR